MWGGKEAGHSGKVWYFFSKAARVQDFFLFWTPPSPHLPDSTFPMVHPFRCRLIYHPHPLVSCVKRISEIEMNHFCLIVTGCWSLPSSSMRSNSAFCGNAARDVLTEQGETAVLPQACNHLPITPIMCSPTDRQNNNNDDDENNDNIIIIIILLIIIIYFLNLKWTYFIDNNANY